MPKEKLFYPGDKVPEGAIFRGYGMGGLLFDVPTEDQGVVVSRCHHCGWRQIGHYMECPKCGKRYGSKEESREIPQISLEQDSLIKTINAMSEKLEKLSTPATLSGYAIGKILSVLDRCKITILRKK